MQGVTSVTHPGGLLEALVLMKRGVKLGGQWVALAAGLAGLVFPGTPQASSMDSCDGLGGAGSVDAGQWPQGVAPSGSHAAGAQRMSVGGMEGFPLGLERRWGRDL